MTSTLYVVPVEHSSEAEEWSGAAKFIGGIKGVFGRVLCDTDGSIGDPTEFSPETALTILSELEPYEPKWPGDGRDLAKVRKWAEAGKRLFVVWQH